MLRRNGNSHTESEVPLFADLTPTQRVSLGRATKELDLPAGYGVIREGAHGNDMFVVVSGTVAVTRRGDAVATLGPGEFFGEAAALSGSRRNASVTTIDPVRVLHIDGRTIPTLIEDNERIASRMAPILASRCQEHQLASVDAGTRASLRSSRVGSGSV